MMNDILNFFVLFPIIKSKCLRKFSIIINIFLTFFASAMLFLIFAMLQLAFYEQNVLITATSIYVGGKIIFSVQFSIITMIL